MARGPLSRSGQSVPLSTVRIQIMPNNDIDLFVDYLHIVADFVSVETVKWRVLID